MWGFSEKEIENYLTEPKGTRPSVIRIDDVRYVVLATQAGLILPQKSTPSSRWSLFPDKTELPEFWPTVEGDIQIPDMIARVKHRPGASHRDPMRPRSRLAVIELKKEDAKEKDVAQLRLYMNLLAYCLEHDVKGIRRKLRVKRACQPFGVLLAPHIPARVWLSACSTSAPDIDLIAYELVSDEKTRRIRSIKFRNCGEHYAKEMRKVGRKYRLDRKPLPSLLEPAPLHEDEVVVAPNVPDSEVRANESEFLLTPSEQDGIPQE